MKYFFIVMVFVLALFVPLGVYAASTDPVEGHVREQGANLTIVVTPDKGVFDRSLNERGWTPQGNYDFTVKVENNGSNTEPITVVATHYMINPDRLPPQCRQNPESPSAIMCLEGGIEPNSSQTFKITLTPVGVEGEKIKPDFTLVLLRDGSPSVTVTPTVTIVDLTNDTGGGGEGGGCLIATAAYGSELAPQIQQLREIRDNKLLQTEIGTNFMNSFNSFYYSFSPTVADLERQNPIFKEIVHLTIYPMISTLSIMDLAETETQVLGLGISVLTLNLGLYVGIPILIGFKTSKAFRNKNS